MEKIKIFLDSNVLFSIAYSGKEKSRSFLLFELQERNFVEIYISNIVEQETLLNIKNKRYKNLDFLIRLIKKTLLLPDINISLKKGELLQLPEIDRIILFTAVYNKIDFFLTGNTRDFKNFYKRKINNTLILTPSDFLNRDF